MSSSREFKDYVLEMLRELEGIECRYMMSEYVLYYNGVIFGGIYDDRLLVKKTPTNSSYKLKEAIPYPKGKPMYLVDNIDDSEYLFKLVLDTYNGLKQK